MSERIGNRLTRGIGGPAPYEVPAMPATCIGCALGLPA
jgi:hypothetical protein